MNWPIWWNWEIEITPHVEKPMLQRNFNEIELRSMLSDAKSVENDVVEGRFLIKTSHHNRTWEIIVEPDFIEKLLVIITAYPFEV